MFIENEFGKILIIPVVVDISANTGLALTITRPDGTIANISAGLTAPNIDVVVKEDGEDVTYLANRYASYLTVQGDITSQGEYKAKLVATFADKELHSQLTRFEVLR